jgi:hypothetical protein
MFTKVARAIITPRNHIFDRLIDQKLRKPFSSSAEAFGVPANQALY